MYRSSTLLVLLSLLAFLLVLQRAPLHAFAQGEMDDWSPSMAGITGYPTAPVWGDNFDSIDSSGYSVTSPNASYWSGGSQVDDGHAADDPNYVFQTDENHAMMGNGVLTLVIDVSDPTSENSNLTYADLWASVNKKSFRYGFFAARIQMPTGSGVECYFGLHKYGTGASIYAVDFYPGIARNSTVPDEQSSDFYYYSELTYRDSSCSSGTCPTETLPSDGLPTHQTSKINDNYHIFWAEWRSDGVTVGFDNSEHQTLISGSDFTSLDDFKTNLLSVYFGMSGVRNSMDDGPAYMSIDWIKVWQKGLGSTTPSSTGSNSGGDSSTGSSGEEDVTVFNVTTGTRTTDCADSVTSQAFYLNGDEAPALSLYVGTTYTFIAHFTIHNFAITSDSSGGGTSNGVIVSLPNGEGNKVTFTPTEVGTYYYVCTLEGHLCMGNTITVEASDNGGSSTGSGGETGGEYSSSGEGGEYNSSSSSSGEGGEYYSSTGEGGEYGNSTGAGGEYSSTGSPTSEPSTLTGSSTGLSPVGTSSTGAASSGSTGAASSGSTGAAAAGSTGTSGGTFSLPASTTSFDVGTANRRTTCSANSATTSGFTINGIVQPTLTLTVGVTYTFKADFTLHHFAIVTTASSDGNPSAESTALALLVGKAGNIIQFTPTAPGSLFYVCTLSSHFCMGNTISVVAATSSGSTGTSFPIPATQNNEAASHFHVMSTIITIMLCALAATFAQKKML